MGPWARAHAALRGARSAIYTCLLPQTPGERTPDSGERAPDSGGDAANLPNNDQAAPGGPRAHVDNKRLRRGPGASWAPLGPPGPTWGPLGPPGAPGEAREGPGRHGEPIPGIFRKIREIRTGAGNLTPLKPFILAVLEGVSDIKSCSESVFEHLW